MTHPRQANSHFIQLSHAKLHYYDWPGTGDPIVLLHATGFHARCWDAVISGLDSRRVIAVDTRCHGLSENTPPPYQWSQFGDDIVELLDALKLSRLILVGHSMGGHLALYVAALRTELVRQVLSIDPVVFAPEQLKLQQQFAESTVPHPAARRRNEWSSAEEMLKSFSTREPFSLWHPRVLEDYCRFGLVEKTSVGGEIAFELACPPELEAAIYKSTGGGRLLELVKGLANPVRLLRARERGPDDSPFDFKPSMTWSGLVNFLPNATELYLPEHTHFLPMEDLELILREILALV